MPFARRWRVLPAMFAFMLGVAASARAALPRVPEGFEVRLLATVPAVLYPCQVATAPDGLLFVAEDPMDQVGPYESFHGRILVFKDGADPVVFADGFRAIQGMAWHKGSLYVSHMPFLTVLRDADGDGKADGRHDLFKDLGPTNNRGLNDHIVSGIQFGIDGYLYISVGDKGIPRATGPDGRTIQIKGGGTCRCRPDGTGLEVVSTGTRNHLDPNLDDRDNLFTYDNTDDGLGWWTRVTHHVDGGYYGYPYDYHDRPDRHLPRMAEYGGGSPCGAVVYKEDAWPEKYRGVALWAEWGKGKVHGFRFAPDGSTFKVAEAIDFAVPNGVENFRPIDLAVSHDGRTLYVADWGMGGWGSKTEKVGRVFAIRPTADVPTQPRGKDSDPIAAQIRQLNHASFNERMRAQEALIARGPEAFGPIRTALLDPWTAARARRHLVWAFAALAPDDVTLEAVLGRVLEAPEADVRAQAVRAMGMNGRPSAAALALKALDDPEPTVRLQAVIALRRLGDQSAVPGLLRALAETDRFIAFSARVALRRRGHWGAASAGLASGDPKVRTGVLAALDEVYDAEAVRVLARFATDRTRAESERAMAVQALAGVHRKARPWDGRWWGTRPAAGAPPAKVVDWEETTRVLTTVRGLLADPSVAVRLAAVNAVRETRDRDALPALREQFASGGDPRVLAGVARALGRMNDTASLPALIGAVRARDLPEAVQESALAAVESIGSDAAASALVEVLERNELGSERLPRLIAALGRFRARSAVGPLVAALKNPAPPVRAAAAEALGKIGELKGVDAPLRALLGDPSVDVRRAAIVALGTLADREAIPALVEASQARDTRFEATRALARMPDLLALQVYIGGLADRSPELREASTRALRRIRADAAPILDQLASRHELPPSVIPELRKIYNAVRPIDQWNLLGPFPIDAGLPVEPGKPIDLAASHPGAEGQPVTWKVAKPVDEKGQIDLNKVFPQKDDLAALGYAEIRSPAERTTEMAVGSDDTLTVWLNGQEVYDFKDRRGYEAGRVRFEVKLVEGVNRVLVKCGNRGGPWAFSVALGALPDHAFLKAPAAGGFDPDAFRAFAMGRTGKAERGRALFQDLKGLACIRCHAVGKEGGTVGPELSSVGAKYPRDELINSVLYPSARISSGYEPVVVAVNDGRVVTGILKSDTPEALELEDAEAKKVRIAKEDIEGRKKSDVSIMPTGLAEGLTREDFADLITYLETLKEVPAKPAEDGKGR